MGCALLGQMADIRGQQTDAKNKEPQNTESAGGGNVEGKENFIISACGGFDIRYSSHLK